jgi:hypothetical protein
MNNEQISEHIRTMVHPWEIFMIELNIPFQSMKWVDAGKCPFCSTANKFRVNFSTGAYKCGACRVSDKDVYENIIRIKKIHFIEAIIWLVKHEESVIQKRRESIRRRRGRRQRGGPRPLVSF